MSIFTKVRESKPRRSTKNLSHDTIFDCGFGKLIPTNFEELTGNDNISFSHQQYIQPATLLAPAFAKIRVRQRSFAVPLHLLYGYDYLESFMSDSTGEFLEPYTTMRDLAACTVPDPWNANASIPLLLNGQMADFMNLPTLPASAVASVSHLMEKSNPAGDEKVSLIKAMAYLKIWNDWYRDENYQPDLQGVIDQIKNLPTFPYVSYTDLSNINDYPDIPQRPLLSLLFELRFANTGHDYFLGALPSQQLGNPVRLPLGDEADVFWRAQSGNLTIGAEDMRAFTQVSADETKEFKADLPNQPDRRLVAKLSDAVALDIVQFRTLEAAQAFQERNSRGGHRLPEILRSRFGARVPDAFLPRSIYIGGSVEDIKIDSIFSTAQTDNGRLGDVAGRAYSAGASGGFYYYSGLPSMVVTLQSVIPVPSYYQGIRKDNQRLTVFDKVVPEFAHVGEQPVFSKEFFFNIPVGTANYKSDSIFGYVPRYADWMVHLDEVHGSFRYDLNFWHTALQLPYQDANQQVVENIELTPQILTQDYYRNCYRIFAVWNNDAEFANIPFRCATHFNFFKTTDLPKHPRSY